MKLLPKWLLFAIIFVILLIGFSFFLPRKVVTSESITINAPVERVFNQINDLHNWQLWSPRFAKDTSVDIKYFGNPTGEGSGCEWKSMNHKIENGSLIIVYSHLADSIFIETEYVKKGKSNSWFTFATTDTGILVKWFNEKDLGVNPVSRIVGILYKKHTERDHLEGLQKLKGICQSLSGEENIKFQIAYQGGFGYLSIRQKVAISDVSEVLQNNFGKLAQLISEKKLKVMNPPFAIYYGFTDKEADVEAGIPVNRSISQSGNIKYSEMRETNAVIADFYGYYNGLSRAHELLQAWIMVNKRKVIGAPREVYVLGPSNETDSTKWHTRIFYPIE